MFANITELELQDNEELIEQLSTYVNELKYVDLDDDSTGDVSYPLCNIRAICDILEDRLPNLLKHSVSDIDSRYW